MSKFIKPEEDKSLNPVDFCNRHMSWQQIIGENKTLIYTDEKTIEIPLNGGGTGKCTVSGNEISFPDGAICPKNTFSEKPYTKFMLLCAISFNRDYKGAISFIEHKIMNKDVPFIRVGTDYYKVIYKKDRYNISRKTLKPWKKETLSLDYDKHIFTLIPRFDDFCIEPSNLNYKEVIDNCYNTYAPFGHIPYKKEVDAPDITNSIKLLEHIFGDQLTMGLTYLKILYELPRQPLPVLSLVSSERQTGKTTFLNWINMIFGDNYILINPEDLHSQFNSSYATKNIIAIDETVIDKAGSVEKLKSIATAKTISVNQKHVANYMLPFFAKVIICTNKELDFMRIDNEEIRFWVRKVPHIKDIDTQIEDRLRDEIPALLKFLHQLPLHDLSKSRMVFTPEELDNKFLTAVKEESRSGLYKELQLLLSDYFNNNADAAELTATAIDIKDHWFSKNSQISSPYIFKVIRDEFKMSKSNRVVRYTPFNIDKVITKTGVPFTFKRSDFTTEPLNILSVFDAGEPPF